MLLKARQPCPCGQSSDAWHLYDDGGYCFSCSNINLPKNFKSSQERSVLEQEFVEATYDFLGFRGITEETFRKYNVLTKIIEGRAQSLFFQYEKNRGKVRSVQRKDFHWIGDKSDKLFGQDVFPPASSNEITITEGELDAATIFQVIGRPAVSIHGAATALRDCRQQREYLASFKKIILAFDGDKAGKAAAQAVVSSGLFDFDRLYWINFQEVLKDANAFLETGKSDELKRMWWNATKFMPDGVISSFHQFDTAIDDNLFQEPIGTWPWPKLQEMTHGLRPGEITLITALEGCGKSEIVRACEYHLLKNHDVNLGVIHLEEQKARSLKGLAGLQLQVPAHFPGRVSNEEIKKALHDLVKRDDRLHVYSQFGSDDPDVILDTMRFLVAACGCQVLALDHITMLVTGKDETDERRYLDYLSTKMGRMVNDLKFHLILVSHVNDEGKTRGSRNISKVCSTRVDLMRDIVAEDEVTRNTTSLVVSKNRFGSVTGPAGRLLFDRETFTLSELPFLSEEPLKGSGGHSKIIDAKELPV